VVQSYPPPFKTKTMQARIRRVRKGRSRLATCRTLALLIPIMFAGGCTQEPSVSEVSAESSGFKPADASPSTPPPAKATESQTASAGNASSPDSPTGIPAVPSLPSFDPGQMDPAIAAKSYMKLEMTSSQDPKEVLRFLGSVDRALQELQADATRGLVNSDLILDRGMAVARLKLTASERLAKVSASSEESSLALIGKLEALGQMAQFKDVPSADELRIVAKQLASHEDPKVASQARRMQLMTAVTDFQNQAATADTLVELATELLTKLEKPDASVFTSVAQAARALDTAASKSQSDESGTPDAEEPNAAACDTIVNLLEAKYREVANPQLGMMAWQMKMQRLPDFETFLKVLDTRMAATADPEEVSAAASLLMEKVPSPWTAMALSQCATQFEYMGNIPLAKKLLDVASTQVASITNEELKAQIDLSIQGFEARTSILGKPLPLENLVDTDGKPLDPKQFEGKVTLVDFWATWCGPCLAEIPNIQSVYEKQHDQGFEVIAINLDEQRSDLDAFLTQQKTPWPVYVSGLPDKTGMNTPLAKTLSITAIPFTLLIGRDGNVSAIHVRGAALATKVEALLGGTPNPE
jgi:thiol-disulfide isomerase/thioredoxin